MLSSDVMRGYNDSIILSLLAEGDSYGYDSMRETTLYSAFNRLERLGYVSSYQGTETFGRKRTYYTITPAGRAFLREKCEEWTLLQQVINQFLKEGDL